MSVGSSNIGGPLVETLLFIDYGSACVDCHRDCVAGERVNKAKVLLTTMSSHTDALQSLRQAIRSRQPIGYSNPDGPCTSLPSATHLVLSPSISIPKSSLTRYRKPGTSSSDFFTVEAVYLAWLLRDAPGAEYMKQARENGLAVGFVSVTERKNVVDWLEGKIADSERIVPLSGAFVDYHKSL